MQHTWVLMLFIFFEIIFIYTMFKLCEKKDRRCLQNNRRLVLWKQYNFDLLSWMFLFICFKQLEEEWDQFFAFVFWSNVIWKDFLFSLFTRISKTWFNKLIQRLKTVLWIKTQLDVFKIYFYFLSYLFFIFSLILFYL